MAGDSTYHVNVIELKWVIIWTGGLPHLSGLPHLHGVSHLHLSRPLVVLDTGRKELFFGVKGSRAEASINECKNFTFYIDDNLANFIQPATFV